MNGSSWFRMGAISGAVVVILGTLLAHGLRVPLEKLDTLAREEQIVKIRQMEVFETGTRYQMYHAVGMVAVGLALMTAPALKSSLLNAAGWAFLLGSVLFSGSLYVIGVGGPRAFGMVAPLGGLSFIAGWTLLAMAAVNVKDWQKIAAGKRDAVLVE